MEQTSLPAQEEGRYDIFLCTRALPDALTAETAAVRQLCSALAGSGYRVFFPSALPELPPEALAGAMAEAARTCPVMLAAAVGDEGAGDATARFLWGRYREMAAEDPEKHFFACVRDLTALPEELQGAQVLDMGELSFLHTLTQLLAAVLPTKERTKEPEEPSAEDAPKHRKRLLWLALGIGALLALGIILCFVKFR